jgi:hypothetical protein
MGARRVFVQGMLRDSAVQLAFKQAVESIIFVFTNMLG